MPILHIDVDYYDGHHRELLSALPESSAIDSCVESGIAVPLEEFYTHYLFHRYPTGNQLNAISYRTVAKQTYKAKTWLDGLLTFHGGSIATATKDKKLPNDVIERTGEAVGLSLANRVFHLTEADWQRIPTARVKTFDYGHDVASDGNTIIQLETKGSCVSDPNFKSPSISSKKSDIEDKKQKINALGAEYQYPAHIRIGTIAVIPQSKDYRTKCWLLDPEPELGPASPRKVRIINRVAFLHRWLSFISPQSSVSIALANRLADLERIVDPDELADSPLLDGRGLALEPRTTMLRNMERLAFFSTKSVVTDGPAGGIVAQATEDAFVFLGIREELVRISIVQNFDEILAYERSSGIVHKTVLCRFSNSRFRRLYLSEAMEQRVERSRDHVSFELAGDLFYSPSGLVFGILQP